MLLSIDDALLWSEIEMLRTINSPHPPISVISGLMKAAVTSLSKCCVREESCE